MQNKGKGNEKQDRNALNNDESADKKKNSLMDLMDDNPYEMENTDAVEDDRAPNIIPDDPIEAEQIESEKLRFGFSFEPGEGQLGDETEDEGDLTADQRKTGNRYKASLGVDDGEGADENIANDQELHVTDTGHIGMAFGEDNYVNDDEEQTDKGKKK